MFDELNAEIITCRKCERLVAWREQVAREKRKAYRYLDYWGKPVPGFGDRKARVFVIGLAPGAHGSNRTGRQFTGDASGNFLYPALYRAGFANRPDSVSRDDGLALSDMYIAASVCCAPPDNKPTPQELAACQPYLVRELQLIQPKVIVALGKVAFESALKVILMKEERGKNPLLSSFLFSHGAQYHIPAEQSSLATDHWLLASYHPSQQNTLTGKLTMEMFDSIWQKAQEILNNQ